jgi:hypothetical protein
LRGERNLAQTWRKSGALIRSVFPLFNSRNFFTQYKVIDWIWLILTSKHLLCKVRIEMRWQFKIAYFFQGNSSKANSPFRKIGSTVEIT